MDGFSSHNRFGLLYCKGHDEEVVVESWKYAVLHEQTQEAVIENMREHGVTDENLINLVAAYARG